MKFSFLNTISPWWKKLTLWAAVFVVFYTVFGFFALPPILRVIAVKQLSKRLDRPVTIQKVRLNPYMLSATIRGLLIKDKDGAPLASWEEVYVNFQLASLFTHAWVFKEVSLTKPFLRAQINKDYTLNFSDIIAGLSPKSQTASWRVNRLRLTAGRISFTDLTPRVPFQRTIGPLELTVANFQTDSAHKNPFELSGVADGGEQFSSKGSFYLAPFRSEGRFSLDGFALTTYAPLYQDLFRFEIKGGKISLRSTYRYEMSVVTNLLAVTNTTFRLESLRMVEKDTGQAVVDVPDLLVTGGSLDAMARHAEANTMTVTGGRFVLRRNKDTSVNAVELLKPADSAPPAPGGIILLLRAMTNLVAMLVNTTNLSNGTIRDLNCTNCALHLEDLANSQPVRLDLEGISIRGKNISNRAWTNMTAKVSLRWNTNGLVKADINAALSPASAEVTLGFDKLNLRPLAPYLESYLDVFLLESKLGLAGKFRLRNTKDELPEVRFQGDAWLDEFSTSTAVGIANEGLLEWGSLRLSGIEANLNPPVVSVNAMRLENVFARLIIETNRTVNLMSALRLGGTNAVTAPQSTNATPAVRPKVSLASVVVSNANVHFIDRSLQPNVNITLGQLNGTVSGLSSDDPERAEVHLQGNVDKTAQAEITGKINPWNSKQPMDLKVFLKEMDLLPADPYSGKYLGYRLTRGTLSAQLDYQVAQQKLKSETRLTIDHLTLGEKVESRDATSLPVRLAIAILKDRAGRISLEVPVDGNLNDSQFNLGQVVSDAIETALTRMVTSPFSVLSALFGGKGEELSFQEFQPGSTNLLPATIAKLDVLAKGLYERPELQLEIEGSADAQTDLEALRRAELNKRLLGQQWSAEANLFPSGTDSPSSEGPLARSSRKAFSFEKGAPALKSTLASSESVPIKSTLTENYPTQDPIRAFADEKGATALMLIFAPSTATTDPDRERALLETVRIPPDAMNTLAVERAQNVKAYLIQTGKVEAQRIAESARGNSAKGSRVYVRLQ